ncbi:hypothetical protein ACNPQM_27910 [Streptomyces sp. NPDC056231]|uniref:hypothetical protein n=1 Tax=Streptomyces sp. NPDC056231 TaxID=3345755 RepID=UPI003AADF09F
MEHEDIDDGSVSRVRPQHEAANMRTDLTAAHKVHGLWLEAVGFLRHNAASVWAKVMEAGGATFVMPPSVARLPRAHDRASALAKAEGERLSEAELFYMNVAAATTIAKQDLVSFELADLLPSPAGLLVWEEPPARVDMGILIRAASWGPAHDGGTWMAWWSDTEECVRAGLFSPLVVKINGRLSYHAEMHTPPRNWPAQADEPKYPQHIQVRSLIGAWAAIRSGVLAETTPLAPIPAERKQMKRLGLTSRPVRCFEPSPSGGTPPTPQEIVRRELELQKITADDRPYPSQLPAELAPWHHYTPHGGHCLMVMVPLVEQGQIVLTGSNEGVLTGKLVSAPVKSVVSAGWEMKNKYIHTPLRYDEAFGLLTDPRDEEF